MVSRKVKRIARKSTIRIKVQGRNERKKERSSTLIEIQVKKKWIYVSVFSGIPSLSLIEQLTQLQNINAKLRASNWPLTDIVAH